MKINLHITILVALLLLFNSKVNAQEEFYIGNAVIKQGITDLYELESWADLNLTDNDFNDFVGSLSFTKDDVALIIYSKEKDEILLKKVMYFDDSKDRLLPLYHDHFKIIPMFLTYLDKGKQVKISYYSFKKDFGFFVIENYSSQEMYLILIDPDQFSRVLNMYK